MVSQDDYIKTALRLPRSLHSTVQESAEEKGRSMNAEIIERLRKSFIPEGVIDTLSVELVENASWKHSTRSAGKAKDDAIYSLLVKVADLLSSEGCTVEDERNLLAEVIRLMAKIRNGYYEG